MAEERAKWTSWHGSPQLLALAIETAVDGIRSDNEPATVQVEISGPGFTERFSSAREFADRATPESLRDFTEINATGSSGNGTCSVALRRSRRLHRAEPSNGVELTIRGPESRSIEIAAVAAAGAATLRRGYRSWWGTSAGTAATDGHRGRNLPLKDGFDFAVTFLAGLLIGLGIVVVVNTLAPEFDPQPMVVALFVIAISTSYGSLFKRVVPSVEVQQSGTSTLVRAFRWTGLLLLGTAVTGAVGQYL